MHYFYWKGILKFSKNLLFIFCTCMLVVDVSDIDIGFELPSLNQNIFSIFDLTLKSLN